MKIKTSELTGAALNWAVAKCEGYNVGVITAEEAKESILNGETDPKKIAMMESWEYRSEPAFIFKDGWKSSTSSTLAAKTKNPYMNFSTDWAQGGPIIESEDISFRKYHNPKSEAHGKYYAKICRESGAHIYWSKKSDQTGPTPLIAAMRCYVANKLGNEVEVPLELI